MVLSSDTQRGMGRSEALHTPQRERGGREFDGVFSLEAKAEPYGGEGGGGGWGGAGSVGRR